MAVRALIILNPWAGRGTGARYRPALEQALQATGIDYELAVTSRPDEAAVIAQHGVERGYERIVAAGGDGTINQVVNGIFRGEERVGRRARLGVIPLGTGVDFIKSFPGFAAYDMEGAARRLAGDTVRSIDLGRARVDDGEPRYYANHCGFGFDSEVAAVAQRIRWIKGYLVYVAAAAIVLSRYRSSVVTVDDGHQTIEQPMLLVSAANGPCQAGRFWFTPNAKIDDGKLDLITIERMRRDQVARSLPLVMRGQHERLRQVQIRQVDRVMISSASPQYVQVDGEILSTHGRVLSIELLPRVLEVIC